MRRRVSVSRGLLLTVSRRVLDNITNRVEARVGYTIQWAIPVGFELRYEPALMFQPLTRHVRNATIQWIHGDHVGLRVELDRDTYVRYTTLEAV